MRVMRTAGPCGRAAPKGRVTLDSTRLHHFELSQVVISFVNYYWKKTAGLLLEPEDLDKKKFLR